MNEMPGAPRRPAVVDLVLCLLAYAASVALKGAVLVGVLHMDARHIRYDDPRIYFVEFLTPLIVLPALTAVLRHRGQTWRDLGTVAPRSPGFFAVAVLGTTAATLAIAWTVRAIPALFGATPPPSDFAVLANDRGALLALASYTILAAGITEEFMMRGFVLGRVAAILGDSTRSWRIAAVVVGIGFGLMHAQHGTSTVVAGVLIGVLYGFVYLGTGRNLWVVAAAHTLHDTVRVLQYYLS